MKSYQKEFLDFAINVGAVRFGEFTLKSGRVSPYFFNAGLFNSGATLARLGHFYAKTILDSGMDFDMLYGPAYKGIPLVAATAIALAEKHSRDVPYAFNRKEAKKHAERGIIVGAPLAGRVVIIDDVISAGISAKEAVEIIRTQGAEPVGAVIALDRQERGTGNISAVQEVKKSLGLQVASIVNLDILASYLSEKGGGNTELKRINAYRETYGC